MCARTRRCAQSCYLFLAVSVFDLCHCRCALSICSNGRDLKMSQKTVALKLPSKLARPSGLVQTKLPAAGIPSAHGKIPSKFLIVDVSLTVVGNFFHVVHAFVLLLLFLLSFNF